MKPVVRMTKKDCHAVAVDPARFLVLEDDKADYKLECSLLCDICSPISASGTPVDRIQVLRLWERPELHRTDAAPGGPQPTWLTAPLRVDSDNCSISCFEKHGNEWVRTVEGQPDEPILVVPWITTSQGDACKFMPHAVVLDVQLQDSDSIYNCTKRLLRSSCYPSDLMWTLTSGPAENAPYGIFVPKQAAFAESEGRSALVRRLSSVLQRHIDQMLVDDRSADKKNPSYRPAHAGQFYDECVISKYWGQRLVFTEGHPHVRKALSETWHARELESEQWGGSQGLLCRIAREPIPGKGLFTFFDAELSGRAQVDYMVGTTFGLPLSCIWPPGATEPSSPEDVLEWAARTMMDPLTSFILRVNLFVFLCAVIGTARPLDRMNAAFSHVFCSWATVDKRVTPLLETTPGSAPNVKPAAWLKDHGFPGKWPKGDRR